MTARYTYSDDFMSALGLWQRGWREDKDERLALTAALQAAVANLTDLPPEARQVPDWCYRKRFLIPNNPQNGGDFWPFFWEGEIVEGMTSWSTDYNYCKVIFKPDPRPGTVACIFRHRPTHAELSLNIAALWSRADFVEAADAIITRGGPAANGLNHFRDTQSEIVLNAPLTMDELFGFCGQVPPLEQLCDAAGISTPNDEDELWRKLVEADYLPTMPFWLEQGAAQRAIERAITAIEERLKRYLKAKS